MDYDILLYDPQSSKNRRGEFVADMVKKSGAQGLVLFMQQFCDPEEMEYPYLKKALDNAGIPHIKLDRIVLKVCFHKQFYCRGSIRTKSEASWTP